MFSKTIMNVVSNFKPQERHDGAPEAKGWADTVPAADTLRDHQLREARTHRAYLPTSPAPLSAR